MKGIDDLLHPVTSCPQNSYGQLAFPTFNYLGMAKLHTLKATIQQYPTELLSLLGDINISDEDGWDIIR